MVGHSSIAEDASAVEVDGLQWGYSSEGSGVLCQFDILTRR